MYTGDGERLAWAGFFCTAVGRSGMACGSASQLYSSP